MTYEHRSTTESVYDELLVLRWQSGEVEAMDELVRRWQPRLFRHVRRLVDSVDEATEDMQETWLAMIRSVRRLDDPKKFPAWAYRIASNKAVDHVRKKARHRTTPLKEPEKLAARDSGRDSTTKTKNMTEMLKKLSVEHRAVVSLRYGEDMPIEAIADSLGIPIGTVKSRLHYALESLRQQTTNHKEPNHGY